MLTLAIFVSLLAMTFISLVVFGGGQVFIPMFTWWWRTLATTFHITYQQNTADAIISVANLTPGVVSTKLAAFTGILIANNQWWGLMILIGTYAFFIIPAIIIMYYANKWLVKVSAGKYASYLQWFKPVIAGILLALVAQLFFGAIFVKTSFNDSYLHYINYQPDSLKAQFFSGWRLIALLVWGPILLIGAFIGYMKNCHYGIIFLVAIIISLIVFEPWLN